MALQRKKKPYHKYYLDVSAFEGMKSLVELHRLAIFRLLGIDINDGLIDETDALFRPFTTSEIKLLNWTRKERKTCETSKSRNTSCYFEITPCCCRDVGNGEGAGETLLELGLSDTKEPFDSFILEFRFWTLFVLANGTWRRDMSRDGWNELGALQSTKKLALWAERPDSLVGLLPGGIEMWCLDEIHCSSRS